MKDKISDHITYLEATASPTALRFGIPNKPSAEVLERMEDVAFEVFEPLREWYGRPIKVNSFFRCEELNKKVGGSPTSQHVKGMAIDLSAGTKAENKKLFDYIKGHLTFDQLIWEYGGVWVHVSYNRGHNRNQVLSIG